MFFWREEERELKTFSRGKFCCISIECVRRRTKSDGDNVARTRLDESIIKLITINLPCTRTREIARGWPFFMLRLIIHGCKLSKPQLTGFSFLFSPTSPSISPSRHRSRRLCIIEQYRSLLFHEQEASRLFSVRINWLKGETSRRRSRREKLEKEDSKRHVVIITISADIFCEKRHRPHDV